MVSTRFYYSELTYATYTSQSSSKVDDSNSSTSTLIATGPNPPLGLTLYITEFLEELITWRILQLYGPFMPAGYTSTATSYFNNSSLHHIDAAQLYNIFCSEFRAEHNSILKRLAKAHCAFNKEAQRNGAIYETMVHVAVDAGLSIITIEKALRLLSDHFKTTASDNTAFRTASGPNATTMASARKWDDLAKSILEDHGALSDPHDPTAQIIRHRTQRLGISITRHLLPAIRFCKQTYFSQLHCRPDANNPKRFELDYMEYRVVPQHQLNDKIGVHMVVQLKKASLKKRTWKRSVRWVAVHPEGERWSWSITTWGSYGSYAPLRRVRAGMEQRTSEPEPGFSREELVDPLRRMKVGEEYANMPGSGGSGSAMEDLGPFRHLAADIERTLARRPGAGERRGRQMVVRRVRLALEAVRRAWAYP